MAYVDDVLCFSPHPEKDLEQIARLLKCSDLLPVNHVPQRHVGMEITATTESFFFDVNGYIRSIPDYESQINALSPLHAFSPLMPHSNLPLYDHSCTTGQWWQPKIKAAVSET